MRQNVFTIEAEATVELSHMTEYTQDHTQLSFKYVKNLLSQHAF